MRKPLKRRLRPQAAGADGYKAEDAGAEQKEAGRLGRGRRQLQALARLFLNAWQRSLSSSCTAEKIPQGGKQTRDIACLEAQVREGSRPQAEEHEPDRNPPPWMLVFPRWIDAVFPLYFLPVFVFELTVGVWLLFRGIRPPLVL